ncbi:MAG: hypothetical protein HKN33_04575 [Pyrinomonadaceae bacterium]|nr:hypothetical protein [Pyrinomonadaceae bacterium]
MELSREAKLDAFFAMTNLFSAESGEGSELREEMSALGNEAIEALEKRAISFDALAPEKQRVWLALWRERLRRRGRTKRLDPSIHPEQVSRRLRQEPNSIRRIIIAHLPGEISRKVVELLEFEASSENVDEYTADNKIVEIVREEFLSGFVAFEDLIKPEGIDQLSGDELEGLIWQLGLRETAIFCRGIEKIEKLAAFLKGFEESTAKEIGSAIADMKDIEIERVRDSEERIGRIFGLKKIDDGAVRRLGLLLLAEVFRHRSAAALLYTVQKLPLHLGEELNEFVEGKKSATGNSDRVSIEIRQLFDENAGGGE